MSSSNGIPEGWERRWSKTWNRSYLYHTATGESKWEEELGVTPAPMTAPSASSSSSAAVSSMVTSSSSSLAAAPDRVPAEVRASVLSFAKCDVPFFCDDQFPLWDHADQSAALSAAGIQAPSIPEVPSIALELKRAAHLRDLRRNFDDTCKARLGTDAPKEAYNRWLYERSVMPGAHDLDVLIPCIPSSMPREQATASHALSFQLMEDVPLKFRRTPIPAVAADNLSLFLEHARTLFAPEDRRALLQTAELVAVQKALAETQAWLRDREPRSTTVQEYVSRGQEVRALIQPLAHRVMADTIAQVVVAVAEDADAVAAYVKLQADRDRQQRQQPQQPQQQSEQQQQQPAGAGEDASKTIVPQLDTDDNCSDLIKVRIDREDSHVLHRAHYKKLQHCYALLGLPESEFPMRLAVMLVRYNASYGNHRFEGSGFHTSLTPAVFETLKSDFAISCECFASPFNSYFARYFSQFPDVDAAFGSLGSFFHAAPVEGSFVCNPPYAEEVMEAAVRHMEHLLGSTSLPLSFIVTVPEWRVPACRTLEMLDASVYLRAQTVVEKNKQVYVSGVQQQVVLQERYVSATSGTHVYILQNDAGFGQWTPTEERLQRLREAMMQTHSRPEGIRYHTADEVPAASAGIYGGGRRGRDGGDHDRRRGRGRGGRDRDWDRGRDHDRSAGGGGSGRKRDREDRDSDRDMDYKRARRGDR
jgi:phosphorylated CTD-interacting factor 1